MRKYEKLSEKFTAYKIMNNKTNFDVNATEYLNLVYGTANKKRVIDYNLSNINDYMDNFVIRFLNTVWTFNELPFVITKEDEDEVERQLYDEVSGIIFAQLKSVKTYFKTALAEFVKTWKELGMGVFIIDTEGDNYTFTSVNPANVQFKTEHNEITDVIIADTYSDWSKNENLQAYKHFEKIDDKWHYSLIVDQHDTTLEHVELDYQPIYIMFYNTRLNGSIPTGKGIELLPVLKTINNILKSLDEAAYKELSPVAIVNTGNIDEQMGDPRYSRIAMLMGTTVIPSGVDNLSDTLRFEPAPVRSEIAYRQLAEYQRQIDQKLSVNDMIISKGTARMTAQETAVRDSYDRESITYLAASVIDELLLPILETLVQHEIKKKQDEDGGEPFREEIHDYKIGINNMIAKADKQVRLEEITNGFNILKFLAELDQAFQGKIDVTGAIQEVSRLTSITADSQTDQATSQLLDVIQQQFSNDAVSGLQQQNEV